LTHADTMGWPKIANGPANDSTVLALPATLSRLAGSSLVPTRMSILPLACGCFVSMTSRTASSRALSRPAMAHRTGSTFPRAEGSGEPGVYLRARYSAARRPVKPLPPHTTRSYALAAAAAIVE
jgi:hypothetical protein